MAFLANLSVFSYIFSGSGDGFQDVGVFNDVLPFFFAFWAILLVI